MQLLPSPSRDVRKSCLDAFARVDHLTPLHLPHAFRSQAVPGNHLLSARIPDLSSRYSLRHA